MNDELPARRSLDSLKKEAKRWLAALRANAADARARLERAIPDTPAIPTLRDVQHALAREHGFPGWSALKETLERAAAGKPETNGASLALFETKAQALLEAYRTGTPDAMENHYRHTWHRRTWQAMRTYVQLDLGKRPNVPDEDVDVTIDDARYLVAIEHGFSNWESLKSFTQAPSSSARLAAKPVRLVEPTETESPRLIASSRDWSEIARALTRNRGARLEAEGQMTDAVLDDITRAVNAEHITALDLGGSKALTDDGIRHLARLPRLEHLDVSGTNLTDRGLSILRDLPALKTLSIAGTRITDDGAANLAHCHALESVNLSWTATGDGALRALAGKRSLRRLVSGSHVTDAGLPLLHELPVFKTWQGGEAKIALLSYDSEPNRLLLRGSFTDRGIEQMRGLDGLFGLNLDDAGLALTAAALAPLVTLPNLGWLAVDAKDDWMPYIAEMPRLRFLGAQDTSAGDDGFVALSESQSLEYIWGRRCHNLRTRGFSALANMPSLRGLSVSCLNVEDAGVATLPSFPALRELMPMDVPDAGYRHIGKCEELESLVLMYCRDTTDAATEHITGLRKLTYYFNSYTTITDRTPILLSGMDSLERITFDACHGLTNAGVAQLARLPRLRELRAAGRQLTNDVAGAFPSGVRVSIGG
jgi:Leucine-rich repeat (LRR) protein